MMVLHMEWDVMVTIHVAPAAAYDDEPSGLQ